MNKKKSVAKKKKSTSKKRIGVSKKKQKTSKKKVDSSKRKKINSKDKVNFEEKRRNIQIVDGALNATFEIFSIAESDFLRIFPDFDKGQEIEFGEDFFKREGNKSANVIWNRLWDRRLERREVQGIHGTLFCAVPERKRFFKNKTWDG